MDYAEFRRQCFKRRQNIFYLWCGSSFELPIKYLMCNITDFDRIVYLPDLCAIPLIRDPPASFEGTVLKIDSSESAKGFARLLKIKSWDDVELFSRPQMLRRGESLGPAVKDSYELSPMKFIRDIECDCTDGVGGLQVDTVFAIYCPYWPTEAEEWRTRKRDCGWPDKRLIERIVGGGCHFVSKLYRNNPDDDTQWRFSFSKAELILIHSWTDVQKCVYHEVKLIKNKITKACGGESETAVCSYHFKTLLFWLCERKPIESCGRIETCVLELLIQLVECLIERSCPNYFIPENNVMADLNNKSEASVTNTINFLMKFIDNGITDIYTLDFVPFKTRETPVKLSHKLSSYLYLHCLCHVNPLAPKICKRLGQYLSDSEWFIPELKYLHEAIMANLRLMQTIRNSELPDREVISIINRNFYSASLESEYLTLWTISFEKNLLENSLQLFAPFQSNRNSDGNKRTADAFYSKISSKKLKKKCYQNDSVDFYSVLMKCFGAINQQEKSMHFPTLVQSLSDVLDDILPGPLFFVCAAYRANFYFVALKDRISTLKECRRAFEMLKRASLLFGDQRIPDKQLMPVLLTNRFSAVFDDHVQTVFGFVTLYRFISRSAPASDLEAVAEFCPVTLLKYLEFQCGRNRPDGPAEKFEIHDSSFSFRPSHVSRIASCQGFSSEFFAAAVRQSGGLTHKLD